VRLKPRGRLSHANFDHHAFGSTRGPRDHQLAGSNNHRRVHATAAPPRQRIFGLTGSRVCATITSGLSFAVGAAVRRTVARPLIAAVLAHAVFGCCLPHVGRCAPRAGSAFLDSAATCLCEHENEGHETGGHVPCDLPDEQRSQHGCCSGDRCVATRPEKPSSSATSLSQRILAVAPTVASPSPRQLLASLERTRSRDTARVALHLIHRALLL
jgi:hypothetical protein